MIIPIATLIDLLRAKSATDLSDETFERVSRTDEGDIDEIVYQALVAARAYRAIMPHMLLDQ